MNAPTPPEPSPTVWSSADLNAYLERQLLVDGKPMAGTEGMTIREIEDDILKGGRFFAYECCVSFIVISYTRHLGARYVRAQQSGAAAAWGYSCISLIFGWWSPSGFIWTPFSLWRNSKGGVDITEKVLTPVIGPERLKSILSKAVKPRRDGLLWLLFFTAIVSPLILPWLFLAWIERSK